MLYKDRFYDSVNHPFKFEYQICDLSNFVDSLNNTADSYFSFNKDKLKDVFGKSLTDREITKKFGFLYSCVIFKSWV